MPSNRELSDLQIGQGRPVEMPPASDLASLNDAILSVLSKEFAVVTSEVFVSSGDTQQTISNPDGVFLGDGFPDMTQFKVVGTDGKVLAVNPSSTIVVVSAILSSPNHGFSTDPVTVQFNTTIPSGITYYIVYGIRRKFTNLGASDISTPDIHNYPIGEVSRRTSALLSNRAGPAIKFGGSSAFAWNPMFTGSLLALEFSNNVSAVLTLTLDSGYTPQVGDELIITVIQVISGGGTATIVWPTSFMHSGWDSDITANVSAGDRVMLFRAVYSPVTLIPNTYAFLVTRTDYQGP